MDARARQRQRVFGYKSSFLSFVSADCGTTALLPQQFGLFADAGAAKTELNAKCS